MDVGPLAVSGMAGPPTQFCLCLIICLVIYAYLRERTFLGKTKSSGKGEDGGHL